MDKSKWKYGLIGIEIGSVNVRKPKRLREFMEGPLRVKSRMSVFLNIQKQKTLNSSKPIWEKEFLTRTSENNGIVISLPTYVLFFSTFTEFYTLF